MPSKKMERCEGCGNQARELYEWTSHPYRSFRNFWRGVAYTRRYCDLCQQDNLEAYEQKLTFRSRLLWVLVGEFLTQLWRRILFPSGCWTRRIGQFLARLGRQAKQHWRQNKTRWRTTAIEVSMMALGMLSVAAVLAAALALAYIWLTHIGIFA